MNKNNQVFDRVTARLKAQVGPEVFTSWFGRLKLQSASKSVVRLSVPTAFLKSWINNKYLDQITALFQEEDPNILKVEITVRSATRPTRPATEAAGEEASGRQPATPNTRKEPAAIRGTSAHVSAAAAARPAAAKLGENTIVGQG